jgi:hypothetical protein
MITAALPPALFIHHTKNVCGRIAKQNLQTAQNPQALLKNLSTYLPTLPRMRGRITKNLQNLQIDTKSANPIYTLRERERERERF